MNRKNLDFSVCFDALCFGKKLFKKKELRVCGLSCFDGAEVFVEVECPPGEMLSRGDAVALWRRLFLKL